MSSPYFSENQLNTIASALSDQGYIILPSILDKNILEGLLLNIKQMDKSCFTTASTGRGNALKNDQSIRGDSIAWLSDDTKNDALRDYFVWSEALRQGLNRTLFLGLYEYECHYAYYPPGAFYAKHVDAFKGNKTRIVSSILYLNSTWDDGDGGELLLYDPQTQELLETVRPRLGTLVLFLSEVFPHEVLPSHKARYSLTGWYRVNSSF